MINSSLDSIKLITLKINLLLRLEKENYKSLIILSSTSGSIFIVSFTTVIHAPVAIASESFSFTFSITTGIVKSLLKTRQNKKKKHNKIVMLPRSILNSIENKISEALINDEISHEDFATIINKEKNDRELKEGIRMMKSQEGDTEKNNLIEQGKKKALIKLLDKIHQ